MENIVHIDSVIDAPRVQLRCPTEADGVLVYEAVMESLAELRQWPASLPWVVFEPSPVASETFCRESHVEFVLRTRLPYLIFEKTTEQFVGCMGVNRIDWAVPKFEIGFWCRTHAQGRGLMTEALGALIDYLRTAQGARRLECYTDEENKKARALCERAGMTLDGTLKNERVDPSGVLRHTVIYSVTC